MARIRPIRIKRTSEGVSISISPGDLIKSVQQQIEQLLTILSNENKKLHHIKPHGALYTDIAKNEAAAKIFLRSIAAYKEGVFLYVPYGSVIEKKALKEGFSVKYEAFADRNYTSDLSLVPRKSPKAVINDPKMVLEHLITMVKKNQVETIEGKAKTILANTFCIHGDTPLAFEIVSYIARQLPNHNIHIK